MRELILRRASFILSLKSARGHFEESGEIVFGGRVMISFVTIGEPDELLEVVGHAGVLVDVVDLHLYGSFGLFFDNLHEDVLSHLLAQNCPSIGWINITKFINGEYGSFHTNNN
jgi:hypothetical protein